VTRTAEALAELVAGALTEAASCGSPALAQTLAAAVRDAAELAGALPPAVRAHDLQVAPRAPRRSGGPPAAAPAGALGPRAAAAVLGALPRAWVPLGAKTAGSGGCGGRNADSCTAGVSAV
jgi:hypothetical protein